MHWGSIKEWIATRVTQLLGGFEEEVLISMIYNYLESDTVRMPPFYIISAKEISSPNSILNTQLDGKAMHVNLTPFLEKNTTLFMKELWGLLASANQTASHIPQALLEAQKAKLDAQQKAQLAVQASYILHAIMHAICLHPRSFLKCILDLRLGLIGQD